MVKLARDLAWPCVLSPVGDKLSINNQHLESNDCSFRHRARESLETNKIPGQEHILEGPRIKHCTVLRSLTSGS